MTVHTKISNKENYGKPRNNDAIEWIVIHYTANRGDTAKNNVDYFAREPVGVSAHYFIDEKEIWQSVPSDVTAYHCGGALQGSGGHAYHGLCNNSNSLGIELCLLDAKGAVRNGTLNRATVFVRDLMAQHGIDLAHVIRHYDVTGKNCPAPFVGDARSWDQFKTQLQTELEEDTVRYQYYEDMPAWAKPTVSKLVKLGLLKGDGSGVLDLSEDSLKVLVINDRAGLYL